MLREGQPTLGFNERGFGVRHTGSLGAGFHAGRGGAPFAQRRMGFVKFLATLLVVLVITVVTFII